MVTPGGDLESARTKYARRRSQKTAAHTHIFQGGDLGVVVLFLFGHPRAKTRFSSDGKRRTD